MALPRMRESASFLPVRTRLARSPIATTTFGSTAASWATRYGRQELTSEGFGERGGEPGGRHLFTVVIYTLSRSSPTSESSRSRSIPEAPWKGLPSLSSLKPGASPTTNSSAFRGPSPNTTCVLEWHSPHFVQPRASFWASAKSKRLELLALREDKAKQQVDHESQQRARTWDDHGDHRRNKPHYIGTPPVSVGHAAADAQDPTVPLGPRDVQDPYLLRPGGWPRSQRDSTRLPPGSSTGRRRAASRTRSRFSSVPRATRSLR